MAGVSTPPAPAPFPRTFYVANAIELFERLAHYGMYVGLSLYLSNVIGMSDVESGRTLGNFRLVGSLAPIVCGAIADRIRFKRALVIAFSLYGAGYLALFSLPGRASALPALLAIAVGGGFMKPVITGTVVRTSPEGRQTEGFAVFYRMVNAGSVVGKTLAYAVRALLALRYVMVTSVVASLVALGLSAAAYDEPPKGAPTTTLGATLRGYKEAFSNLSFVAFLLVFSGYYFMAEQFYMTFPKHVTRVVDEHAPLELVTLVNPLLIAIFGSLVARKLVRVPPRLAMALGVGLGAVSMLVMGALPSLAGAVLSGAVFAFAEMTFSPRFYDSVASFAPEGKAGLYMGLAFVPSAIGAWIGGQVSGPLIAAYLPKDGPKAPLVIWSSYAAFGLVCALLMVAYHRVTKGRGEGAP